MQQIHEPLVILRGCELDGRRQRRGGPLRICYCRGEERGEQERTEYRGEEDWSWHVRFPRTSILLAGLGFSGEGETK